MDIGSYCVGHGSLHTEDIENIVGTKCASETMSRIMWAVGVTSWESLKGKYCRVKITNELEGKITSIGHILSDKWFDIQEYMERTRDKVN